MKEHNKIFLKYTIPAVVGMLVATLYTFVDGIFVGNYVGPNAIAAIGIVWPFNAITMSLCVLIGTGGGALASINFGRGNRERAQSLFSQSITLAFLISLILSFICIIFPKTVVKLLGSNDALLGDCIIYLRFFMLFGCFNGGAIILNIFVNNDRNPILALCGMISGCVTNIVLDYFFVKVFSWGLIGAAVASGLGQVVACVTLLMHFVFKKGDLKFKFSTLIYKDAKKIIVTGIPAFVNEVATPISAIVFNYVIVRRMGEWGVAIFSIVAYLLTLYYCALSGVAQGLQPPMSRFYGEKRNDILKELFRTAIIVSELLGVFIFVVMIVFSKQAVGMFTQNADLINDSVSPLRLYSIFCIFFAVNVVIVSALQATRITKAATIISVFRCFFTNITCVLVLPLFLGNTGIWLAAPLSELLVLVLAVYQFSKNKNTLFAAK